MMWAELSWKDAGDAFVILGIAGLILWLWLRPKIQADFASKAAFEAHKIEVEGRLAEQDARIEALSVLVRDQINGVERRLSSDISGLGASIAGLTATVNANNMVMADVKESLRDLTKRLMQNAGAR